MCSLVNIYKMYLICNFIAATSTRRQKNAPGGALYEQSVLATKQIALFRFKRLSDKHQYTDHQIGCEDADQPLRHFKRQEFPLAYGAVTGSDKHLRQPFIQRQPRWETSGEIAGLEGEG